MKDEYIPGDYYVICDRCGFKRRVSTTRREWNGLLVCYPECWEARHPQDFVRAKRDKQRVPIARPDENISPITTALSSAASAGDKTIDVADYSNISKYTAIGIKLNSGASQWTFAAATPTSATVTLNDTVWEAAASGNDVFLSSASCGTFISTYEEDTIEWLDGTLMGWLDGKNAEWLE